ncbi:MAG: 50S ribosomal protein L23 [Patescibacteria group bacterium]
MLNIIIKPVITEKSLFYAASQRYSFFIHPKANKYQVKSAIKQAFKVDVETVRIVNVKSKKRRRGRFVGQTAAAKKAIVTLAKDQKIEFFDKL